MPFQPGNIEGSKSRKAKPYADALRMEIAAAENAFDLRAIARAHLLQASKGDMPAIRELADRLDGKVPQAIGGTEELDPIQMVVTGVPRVGDQS